VPDPVPQLLHGPYHPPALQVGDRAHCLLRDCQVTITTWTDAPISWPRCQPVGQRGGCGLLLEEELARAVRSESALAVMHWWESRPGWSGDGGRCWASPAGPAPRGAVA